MSNVIRLFISSTFKDFEVERELLRSEVFPKIEKYCKGKGFEFEPVDLRWGITESASKNNQTMRLCLDEIDRCKRLSPKPNFLILSGYRYGWEPLPVQIPVEEYELFNQHLEEQELFHRCYEIDHNQIPSSYMLQSQERLNFELSTIAESLHSSVWEAVSKTELSAEKKMKYHFSATHQEIYFGALRTAEDTKQTICLMREFSKIPAHGILCDEDLSKVLSLRNSLVEKIPSENLIKYNCKSSNDLDVEFDRKQFVEYSLNKIIQKIKESTEVKVQNLSVADAQARFLNSICSELVGREKELDQVVRLIAQKRTVLVVGNGGTGKTVFIAGLVKKLQKSNAKVFFRFMGASENTNSLVGVLNEAISFFNQKESPISKTESIQTAIFGLIKIAKSNDENIYVIIDAIDQAIEFSFIRDNLSNFAFPPNLHIIFSSIPCKESELLIQMISFFGFELNQLDAESAKIVIDNCLLKSNRKVTQQQLDYLLDRFKEFPNPLYLKLIISIAARWTSSCLAGNIGKDIDEVIGQYFDSISSTGVHPPKFVEALLAYLLQSRMGLSDRELLKLLSLNQEVWLEFENNSINAIFDSNVETRSIPFLFLSRLKSDIQMLLSDNIQNGITLTVFFHRVISEGILARFSDQSIYEYRKHLKHFFGDRKIISKESFSARDVFELPFQLLRGREIRQLAKCLMSFDFLYQKLLYKQVNDLEMFFNLTSQFSGQIGDEGLYLSFKEWLDYFNEIKLILFASDQNNSKSAETFFQISINKLESNQFHRAAKDFLEAGKFSSTWLKPGLRVSLPSYIKRSIGGNFHLALFIDERFILQNSTRIETWNKGLSHLFHHRNNSFIIGILKNKKLVVIDSESNVSILGTDLQISNLSWKSSISFSSINARNVYNSIHQRKFSGNFHELFFRYFFFETDFGFLIFDSFKYDTHLFCYSNMHEVVKSANKTTTVKSNIDDRIWPHLYKSFDLKEWYFSSIASDQFYATNGKEIQKWRIEKDAFLGTERLVTVAKRSGDFKGVLHLNEGLILTTIDGVIAIVDGTNLETVSFGLKFKFGIRDLTEIANNYILLNLDNEWLIWNCKSKEVYSPTESTFEVSRRMSDELGLVRELGQIEGFFYSNEFGEGIFFTSKGAFFTPLELGSNSAPLRKRIERAQSNKHISRSRKNFRKISFLTKDSFILEHEDGSVWIYSLINGSKMNLTEKMRLTQDRLVKGSHRKTISKYDCPVELWDGSVLLQINSDFFQLFGTKAIKFRHRDCITESVIVDNDGEMIEVDKSCLASRSIRDGEKYLERRLNEELRMFSSDWGFVGKVEQTFSLNDVNYEISLIDLSSEGHHVAVYSYKDLFFIQANMGRVVYIDGGEIIVSELRKGKKYCKGEAHDYRLQNHFIYSNNSGRLHAIKKTELRKVGKSSLPLMQSTLKDFSDSKPNYIKSIYVSSSESLFFEFKKSCKLSLKERCNYLKKCKINTNINVILDSELLIQNGLEDLRH